MRVLSRGPSADYRFPGSMSGFLGASSVPTSTVGRHHHSGLHQRHDCSPAVQEAEGRGRNTHTRTHTELSECN